MPSHPDRVRRHYDPNTMFPIEIPDTEIEVNDAPLDEDADISIDDVDARDVDRR